MTDRLLQAILDELRSGNRPAIALGFGHPPKPRYIYANRQYSECLWYFWNGADNKHEPIAHHALTGTIEKLEIETKEFRGKPDPKVNLTIRADRTYIIQAGFDTLFAKGLLFTLAKLPIEAFRQPITIAVEPGETEQVLFCRIYNPSTGNSVYAPYPDDVDWAATTQRVIDKITVAKNEPAPPPEPMVKDRPEAIAPPEPTLPRLPDAPPEPSADPLTGQTALIPEEGPIVDALNSAIRTIRSPYDAVMVRRDIESRRNVLGEPMFAAVMARFNAIDAKLDYAGAIGGLVSDLRWEQHQAADKLQEWFGVRSRSQLSALQLRDCYDRLRALKSADRVLQGAA
jgi:hypothetical protein